MIPILVIAGLVGPIAGWIVLGAAYDEVVRRIADQSSCPACHYDLSGVANGGASCPECGRSRDAARQSLTGGSWRALMHPALVWCSLLVINAVAFVLSDAGECAIVALFISAPFVQIVLAGMTTQAFRSPHLARWCLIAPSWLAFVPQALILTGFICGWFQPLPAPFQARPLPIMSTLNDSFMLTSVGWSIAALAIAGWVQVVVGGVAFLSRWPLVGSVTSRSVR